MNCAIDDFQKRRVFTNNILSCFERFTHRIIVIIFLIVVGSFNNFTSFFTSENIFVNVKMINIPKILKWNDCLKILKDVKARRNVRLQKRWISVRCVIVRWFLWACQALETTREYTNYNNKFGSYLKIFVQLQTYFIFIT